MEGEEESEERKRGGGEEEMERWGLGICVEESVASLLALSWGTDPSVYISGRPDPRLRNISSLDVFVHQRISAAESIDTKLQSNDQSVRKNPDIGRSFSHISLQNHIISSGPPAWFVVTVQGPTCASSLAADALRNADRAL